jgi:uncharacterized protein YkwD
LLAAFAAALVLAPLGSPAAVGDCTPGAGFRPANAALGNQILRLVNQHRQALGLRELKVSKALTDSAVWKARHMATYSYMAHDDPAPPIARGAGDRIAACGYRGGWGENIAAGLQTPSSVLAAWLQSPGHRANIENPAYVVTGVGVSTSAGGAVLWAQDFGLSDDSGSAAPPTSSPPAASQGIVLQKLRITERGGRLALHARAVLSPSMRLLRNGSTGCGAVAGGHKLHVIARRFAHGAVSCVWRVLPGAQRVEATVYVSGKTGRSTHATVAVLTR